MATTALTADMVLADDLTTADQYVRQFLATAAQYVFSGPAAADPTRRMAKRRSTAK